MVLSGQNIVPELVLNFVIGFHFPKLKFLPLSKFNLHCSVTVYSSPPHCLKPNKHKLNVCVSLKFSLWEVMVLWYSGSSYLVSYFTLLEGVIDTFLCTSPYPSIIFLVHWQKFSSYKWPASLQLFVPSQLLSLHPKVVLALCFFHWRE